MTSPRAISPTTPPREDGWEKHTPKDPFHHPLHIGRDVAVLFYGGGRVEEEKAAVLTVSDGLFPLVGQSSEVKAFDVQEDS